ncbi:MAG: hypothetical protein PVH41_02285 [Anaerolineae bacterium]|jgi:hypothetical protein
MRKEDQVSEIVTLSAQCQDRKAVGGWPEARRIADAALRAGSR